MKFENFKYFKAKTISGAETEIGVRDCGRIADGDGGFIYQTLFDVNGNIIVSEISAELAEKRDSGFHARLMEDNAHLEAVGVDPSSIEF